MNTRERFLAVMNFEPVDRTLRWEMGYWIGALKQWYKDGLPLKKGVVNLADGRAMCGEDSPLNPESAEPLDAARRECDVANYFGHDGALWRVPLNNYLCPLFEPEILEDHGNWILHRNEYGVIVKDQKDCSGFPDWVETPVKTWDDWERLKAEKLRPSIGGRLPDDWPKWKKIFSSRTFPLLLGGYPAGFYGTARFLFGEENVMLSFYDQPDLVKNVMDYLADFWVALYDQILPGLDVDSILFWEDMCYKRGPLISPEMFKEFILPNYKKVTDCVKSHGVKVIMVDTDGQCGPLIPLFIEGGVNAMCPFEQNAGMDIIAVRKSFPKLGIIGGIDKTKIKDGPDAIDKELEKIPFMLKQGGFIPHVDHHVPSDVSWTNFKYYRNKLNQIIG
jgi:uroporphyrinogen decarboxylase